MTIQLGLSAQFVYPLTQYRPCQFRDLLVLYYHYAKGNMVTGTIDD